MSLTYQTQIKSQPGLVSFWEQDEGNLGEPATMADAFGSHPGAYEDWPRSRQIGPLAGNSDNLSEQYSDYNSILPYSQVATTTGGAIPGLNRSVFTTEMWVDVLGRVGCSPLPRRRHRLADGYDRSRLRHPGRPGR